MSEIAVIGAGAWGTAIATVLGRKQTHHVRLWAHEAEVRESIRHHHINDLFLPQQRIPEAVECTNSLEEALQDTAIVVSVMPSHHTRRIFQAMFPHLRPEMLFVSATKGIENDSLLRMTEVITQVLNDSAGFVPRIGALSGPSFAKEVAKGDPTAITIASADRALAVIVQKEFSDPNFRVYTNDDIVGVELGGALKNIVAIAAGVLLGMDLGYNTVAALITRGLAEITRLVVACGGTGGNHGRTSRTRRPGAHLHRAVSRETGASALNWDAVANWMTSSRGCMAWSRKECLPPTPRSAWLAGQASKCPLPSRCTPFSNKENPCRKQSEI